MKKLRKLTQEEVNVTCKKHEAWLAGGEKADFRHADLRGLSLKNADLRFANLEGADLRLVRATYATFDDCTANSACFTEAQLTECLRAAWSKARNFRLRGVTDGEIGAPANA